jgi:hypothetical protein
MHNTYSSTTHSWVHLKGYHRNRPAHMLLFQKLGEQYKDLATLVQTSQLLRHLDPVHREEQDHLQRKRAA